MARMQAMQLCLSNLIFYLLFQTQWHANFHIFKNQIEKACGYHDMDTNLAPC